MQALDYKVLLCSWPLLELLVGNIRGTYCSALRTKAAVG